MKWALRAVTLVLVLGLAVLGGLIYRLETERPIAAVSDGPSDVAIGKA